MYGRRSGPELASRPSLDDDAGGGAGLSTIERGNRSSRRSSCAGIALFRSCSGSARKTLCMVSQAHLRLVPACSGLTASRGRARTYGPKEWADRAPVRPSIPGCRKIYTVGPSLTPCHTLLLEQHHLTASPATMSSSPFPLVVFVTAWAIPRAVALFNRLAPAQPGNHSMDFRYGSGIGWGRIIPARATRRLAP